MTSTAVDTLLDWMAILVRPGMRVALGDGPGSPVTALDALTQVAAERGDISLLLGWTPRPVSENALAGFAEVRALMSGWGLRRSIDAGTTLSVPCRMSAIPSLLGGPLRPDLLVTTLVRRNGSLYFGTEASWMRRLVEAGLPVAAVVSTAAPCADAGAPLPEAAITVVCETDERPFDVVPQPPGEVEQAIAAHVVRLIPAGARVQVGPGRLGAAILGAIETPVEVDSGLLPDAVVDLDERGLLLATPVATYLAGSRRLYDWADGRPILQPVEWTHDPGRLGSGSPFIALNTALEIDLQGQVNAEAIGGSTVGGIGGHPDFAGAATRSRRGLSVIALASSHAGTPTLVSRLSRPVTTASHDVDIVVTERGVADLRGLSRPERTAALWRLWDGAAA